MITLYSVSRQYNVDLTTLSRVNDLRSPYTLHVGQKLLLSGTISGNSRSYQAAQDKKASVSSASKSKMAQTSGKKQAPKKVSSTPYTPPKNRTAKFLWPVKGTVVSNFGVIGKENRGYVPYLITVLLYLGMANTIALFGFKPPTKDLNVTAALAIMSMFVIEFSGIRKNGVKHWVKHFGQPVPVVAPIMALEVVIRPLSLCMRLFGNMLAGFVVLELLKYFVPLIVPIPVSFYFDLFDGLLQAYVFVFLTALFMTEEME